MNRKICYLSISLSCLLFLLSLLRRPRQSVIDAKMDIVREWDSLISKWEKLISYHHIHPDTIIEANWEAEEIYRNIQIHILTSVYHQGIQALVWIERYGKKMPNPSIFAIFPGDFEERILRIIHDELGKELTLFVIITEGNEPPPYAATSPSQ